MLSGYVRLHRAADGCALLIARQSGNIGSEDRLDFTVVGPAVNEVSRIAALCRSVEKDVLISSSFGAAALPEDRGRFVSVGRYALRGVQKAQELFTLERE